jgi:hypothetical protein
MYCVIYQWRQVNKFNNVKKCGSQRVIRRPLEQNSSTIKNQRNSRLFSRFSIIIIYYYKLITRKPTSLKTFRPLNLSGISYLSRLQELSITPLGMSTIKPDNYGNRITGDQNEHVYLRGPFEKVRGLTLLLRVGTSWRWGDGLFFEVPLLASDVLITTLHPLLENVLQTIDHFEISCLGAPFSWLEKPRNRMGRDLSWILCSVWKKWIDGTPLEHPPYSPDLALCDFRAFPTMKRELRGKKFRSDQRSAARFWEVGGAL